MVCKYNDHGQLGGSLGVSDGPVRQLADGPVELANSRADFSSQSGGDNVGGRWRCAGRLGSRSMVSGLKVIKYIIQTQILLLLE